MGSSRCHMRVVAPIIVSRGHKKKIRQLPHMDRRDLPDDALVSVHMQGTPRKPSTTMVT